jgi:hypothetical protein
MPLMAGVWRSRAEELTEWTERHLVNRRDVWGGYTPLDRRGEQYTKSDGTLGTVPNTLTHPRKRQRGERLLHDGDTRGHYLGARPDHVIGLHTTAADGTCRWLATESDVHDDGNSESPEVIHAANSAWYRRLTDMGITALMTDSNGKGGVHLRALLAEPVPSELAFAFANWLIADFADFGMDRAPEVFPKQPRLDPEACPYGNWLRLPGRHHTRDHWSRVWDGDRWLEGHAAIDFILALKPCAPRLLWDALGLDPAAGVAGIPDELIEKRRATVASGGGCVATESSSGTPSSHRHAGHRDRDPAPPEVFRQAQAWAERQPVSRQGRDGSGTCMAFIRGLWTGWCLSEGQVWEVVRVWNGRCLPPWSDAELAHKIATVVRTADPRGNPDGYLRSDYDGGRPLSKVDIDRLFAGVRERARQRRQASPVLAAGGDGATAVVVREAMPDISDLIGMPADPPTPPDADLPDMTGVSLLRDDRPPPCTEPIPERPNCHRYKVRLRCGNRYMAVAVPCDSWRCDVCCEWLKATWARRIRYHVSLLDPGATLYVAYVTFGTELNSAQKAVNRAGGAYAHVLDERTCQRLFVATTPFRGAEAVTVAEALRRAEDAIATLTAGCSLDGTDGFVRPVVCSRRWPEPPEDVAEEAPARDDWQWDGRLSDEMDLDAAPRVLRSWGIRQFANRDSGRRRYLVFDVPEDFTAAERGELWRCLQRGQTREEMRAASEWTRSAFERLHQGTHAHTGVDGG